jgi:hypothetical protein
MTVPAMDPAFVPEVRTPIEIRAYRDAIVPNANPIHPGNANPYVVLPRAGDIQLPGSEFNHSLAATYISPASLHGEMDVLNQDDRDLRRIIQTDPHAHTISFTNHNQLIDEERISTRNAVPKAKTSHRKNLNGKIAATDAKIGSKHALLLKTKDAKVKYINQFGQVVIIKKTLGNEGYRKTIYSANGDKISYKRTGSRRFGGELTK